MIALPSTSNAQVDQRIVDTPYRPDIVYPISVGPGFAAVVELKASEVVESVVVGDPIAWVVETTASGNRVVITPSQTAGPTNMVIITTERTYTFTLSAFGVRPIFVMRFQYPSTGELENGGYKLKGDDEIYPRLMTDNGSTTSIFWSARTAFPAVFIRDKTGEEVAAPSRAVGDGIVLDGVYEQIIFRRGKLRATAVRDTTRSKH